MNADTTSPTGIDFDPTINDASAATTSAAPSPVSTPARRADRTVTQADAGAVAVLVSTGVLTASPGRSSPSGDYWHGFLVSISMAVLL